MAQASPTVASSARSMALSVSGDAALVQPSLAPGSLAPGRLRSAASTVSEIYQEVPITVTEGAHAHQRETDSRGYEVPATQLPHATDSASYEVPQ
jgi:hypothetical protein